MAKNGPIDTDKIIGAKIRERRKALGLTQGQLADALKLTFQQVQKYERGVNRVAASTLVRIAPALRCQVADLLPEPDATAEDNRLRLPASLLATTQGGLHIAQRFLDMDPPRRAALIRVADAMGDANGAAVQ